MLFHLSNTALQAIIGRKIDLKILLQIPIAFLFGYVINTIQGLLSFTAETMVFQIFVLLMSVFFTALGMVLMVNMQLVQNPPDGTVRQISMRSGKEIGRVKIIYDITCVVISASIGLLFLHRIVGFGIATIASALTVGRLVSLMNPLFSTLFKSKSI